MLALQESPIAERHIKLGAKMTPFSGWSMPLQYSSPLVEHQVVREEVGVFDVSHMGVIRVEGDDAERFLDYIATNRIAGVSVGRATYTPLCHASGGTVDDTIVYRTGEQEFFVVANAGNRDKDLQHLQQQAAPFSVSIISDYDSVAILAVQGPKSLDLLNATLGDLSSLKRMRLTTIGEVTVARTGYTGSLGYELFIPISHVGEVWDRLIEGGATPIGLAARDSLRLEAGYALYGHELSDNIMPTETIASWAVKTVKEDFLGREALLEGEGLRQQYGVLLCDKGIAREGYTVYSSEGEEIGLVTSGGYSPVLEKSIALVMVNSLLNIGDSIQIQVRNKRLSAKVCALPFIKL